MGPSLVFELGGGAGGVSGLMNHLNDSISLWLGDMADWKNFRRIGQVAQEGVNAGWQTAAQKPGNTHQSLEKCRDAMLIQLLKLHIVISLVAFVSGSAYGIFFCRQCPQRVRHRARSRRNPDGRNTATGWKKSPRQYSTTAKTLQPTMMCTTFAGRMSLAVFSCGGQRTRRTRCGADGKSSGQAAGKLCGR